MGLGAFPASDRQFLGMVGMHGTYEANNAMHDCDVMISVGARFDDRVTGKARRLLARLEEDPHRHRPVARSTRTCASTCRWSATPPRRSTALIAALEGASGFKPDRESIAPWWKQIDGWRARNCLAYAKTDKVIKPQYAIERLYAADARPRHLHHHRGRPAPDVGGAVLQVREAVPLDDLGRARHHGLRPAGGDGRADRASRRAGRSTSPARPRS